MLRPVIGLDMDRDQGIWKFFLNGFFDPVADVVSGIYAHATRHHQMEINEHHATCVPGAKVMCMGLSISRSIIEAHGGRLWATRCEPRGALFQFTIPAD